MENQENKLRVKLSTFQTDLSFNEWVKRYKVGSGYVEPTKYFQGNPSCGIHPIGVCTEPPTFKERIREVILPFFK